MVYLRQLIYEIHQIWILRHHKGGDDDPVTIALSRLVQGLVYDLGVELEGVLVDPTILEDRRWLSVCNHEYLLVGVTFST